jgi:hypothetical protein
MQKPDTSDLNAWEDFKMVAGFAVPLVLIVGVVALLLYGLFA